ncbi:MAG TPA: hypothetical protein VIU12_28755 [Chryseolinea sp.]
MKNLFALIALASLLSCNNDAELRKTVSIPDTQFPELPQYSEWGYNTFGAYYGRQPFVANNNDVPLVITNHDNVTVFAFKGQLGQYSYSSNASPFLLTLTFSEFHPETFEDLLALNETSFDLTDPQIAIEIKDANNVIHSAEILEGQFQVKRAQLLLVDKEKQEVILSGVFDFQAIFDGEAVSVSEGRFDIGVAPNNFFKY